MVLIPASAIALIFGAYLIYQFEFVQLPAMKFCVGKAQAFQGNDTMIVNSGAAHQIYDSCMSAKGLAYGS